MRCSRRLRKEPDAGSPPLAGASDWEDTVAESAALAYVLNERPDGVGIGDLAIALGIQVERARGAVAALVEAGILEAQDEYVRPASRRREGGRG